MLHILLTIVKVLGILLLVVLGIVLAVILAVLFVPIRYSVRGEKYREDASQEIPQVMQAKVVVSWLAHLVHFRFRIQNQGESSQEENVENNAKDKEKSKIKTDMELYLFGIPIFAFKNKISQKRAKSKEKNVQEAAKERVQPEDAQIKDIQPESSGEQKTFQDSQTVVEEDTVWDEENEWEEDELLEEVVEETKKAKGNPIKNLLQTIKGIPTKVKATIENIKLTIQKLWAKIRAGSDFLKRESTKATIRLVWEKLKVILLHILPKKIKGTLVFGFDDPALTGEVLGVASLFYPKYHKTLKLIPVFEEPFLEGKLLIKGRIVIAYLIWQVIKIILAKNTKIVIQDVKKLVAEIKA